MSRRHRFSYFVPIALLLVLASCMRPTADPHAMAHVDLATHTAVASQATGTQLPASTATLFPPPTPLPGPPSLTASAGPIAAPGHTYPKYVPCDPLSDDAAGLPATPDGPSEEVLVLVNEHRVASGLAALAWSPELARARLRLTPRTARSTTGAATLAPTARIYRPGSRGQAMRFGRPARIGPTP